MEQMPIAFFKISRWRDSISLKFVLTPYFTQKYARFRLYFPCVSTQAARTGLTISSPAGAVSGRVQRLVVLKVRYSTR